MDVDNTPNVQYEDSVFTLLFRVAKGVTSADEAAETAGLDVDVNDVLFLQSEDC